MEEGQNVQQLSKLLFRAFVNDVLGKLKVVLFDVCTKTIWWFCYNLEGSLKDTKWEFVSWIRGQPKSELFVWL